MIYGLDHNVDRGKVKGLENKSESLSLTIGSYGLGWCPRACVFAFGYGAVAESGGRNRTLSCSVRLTLTAAKKQRLHNETKNRQVKKAGGSKSGRGKGELKIEK